MTNRNQRIMQPKINNWKIICKKNKRFLKGRWKKRFSIMLSFIALIVSILTYSNQKQYAEMEYKYKLEPEIELSDDVRVTLQRPNDGTDMSLISGSFNIDVLQKNNLRRAYLIRSDYSVEKLEVNDMEQTLKNDWKDKFQLDNPDLEKNGMEYCYDFLFLEGLDGSSSLYLIYLKYENVTVCGVGAVTGVELIEFEKSYEDDKEYEGERELAKLYLEVWDECQKYRHEL